MEKAPIKRIFLTGAPGSGWGRVDKCIRGSVENINNTDIVPHRLHSSGNTEKSFNHMGAFFDPGTEFGEWILGFADYSKEEIEYMLDHVFNEEEHPEVVSDLGAPWMGKTGDKSIRIHKSHYWPYHLDKIHKLWPDAMMVLHHQVDHKCYVWWEHTGGFQLEYDSYYYYENDYEAIWNQIRWQNAGIERFAWENKLEPEVFNMDWIHKQFGGISPILEMPQDWSNKDGIPRLHIPPGGQRGLNGTGRVYCFNPWR
jgi:hypothetical protein